MAIQVICPGCLRRFEVSDKFAGKKGPCPKCGHIIEIPKETVVIHAPDEIVVEGRRVKNPDLVRPIERGSYAFTRRQTIINIVGLVVVFLVAFLFSFLSLGPVKWGVGILGIFVVSFGLARNGYILVRDPDDLEIFLGGTLFRKSVLVAIGYTVAWLIFEVLLTLFNPGFYCFLLLLPIAILAPYISLVVFDIDYGDSLMLFIVFFVAMMILRGIMFQPDGWIWKPVSESYRAKQAEAVKQVEEMVPESLEPVMEGVAEELAPDDTPVPTANSPNSSPKTRKLDKRAPDPRAALGRK